MNISDLLSVETVKLGLKSKDKDSVIDELLNILIEAKKLDKKSKSKVKKSIKAREKLGSTGIGQGVGVPHAKDSAVKKLTICCGISKSGVDFESLDGELVNIFFMILAPKEATGEHLKTLAKISRLVRARFFRASLIQCKDPKNLLSILKREEEELG
jgi:fructose PTS system EIIBC or EIIC component